MGGMAMHNRFDIAPMFHNRNMLPDFAGHFSMTRDLIPFHISHAKIIWFHKTFADSGGCADDAVFVDSIGDVSIICCYEAAMIEPAADIADFVFYLFQI